MKPERVKAYRITDSVFHKEATALDVVRRLDMQLYDRPAVYLSREQYHLLRQQLIDTAAKGSVWGRLA